MIKSLFKFFALTSLASSLAVPGVAAIAPASDYNCQFSSSSSYGGNYTVERDRQTNKLKLTSFSGTAKVILDNKYKDQGLSSQRTDVSGVTKQSFRKLDEQAKRVLSSLPD